MSHQQEGGSRPRSKLRRLNSKDAKKEDLVVMGAGANATCLRDGDERINEKHVDLSVSQFPYWDKLLSIQAREKWKNGKFHRLPVFSRSVQLTGHTLPEGFVGEMETAGLVDAARQMEKTGRYVKVGSLNIVSEEFLTPETVVKYHSQVEKLTFLRKSLPQLVETLVKYIND